MVVDQYFSSSDSNAYNNGYLDLAAEISIPCLHVLCLRKQEICETNHGTLFVYKLFYYRMFFKISSCKRISPRTIIRRVQLLNKIFTEDFEFGFECNIEQTIMQATLLVPQSVLYKHCLIESILINVDQFIITDPQFEGTKYI